MTQTVDKASVVGKSRQVVASRTVLVRADTTGVVPMERRDPKTGHKIVSTCDYTHQGKMTNVQHVRPLNFGANGVQIINPADADDAHLLKECKLWLEDGSDARIKRFNIRIQEGGSAEGSPIPRYDKYKPDALIQRMTDELDLIADDPTTAREFLEACARYELQRVHPPEHKNAGASATRPKVLDAIDELGHASGVEYGMDAVEEL